MRVTWKLFAVAIFAWVLLFEDVGGQVPTPPAAPTAPGVPGIPAPPGTPAIPTTPAVPTKSIWNLFCPPPGCWDKCKERYCKSGISKLVQAMFKPMILMSGGLITPCCPTADMPNPADLAKDATSTDGAAARIKKDEMEAKERRANVKFLGTVDCHRYPEAEEALIKALRTDRNECVRFEAALALGNGCCCTKKTVEALMLTASASEKDGNPSETSPRVIEAASQALSMCQLRVAPQTAEPPEKAPPPLPEKKAPDLVQRNGSRGLLPALFSQPPSANPVGFPLPSPAPETNVPTGQRGLFQVFMRRARPAND